MPSENPIAKLKTLTAPQEAFPHKKNDLLLKGAFEDCFIHLLRFFFKDADQIFDMARGVVFLDKELKEITPQRLKQGGPRTSDMLVKVFQLDGEEQWIITHLEIQGETDEAFRFRMFEYYYKIIDRFNRPVVAFAIFTGSKNQLQPAEYTYKLLGTEITYRYNIYQIFQHTDEELLAWNNPFALIVLAAKKAHLEKKSDPELLNRERTMIARALIASGKYDRTQIESFTLFLKNILFIRDKKINSIFDQEIAELTEGEIDMPGIMDAVIQVTEQRIGKRVTRRITKEITDSVTKEVTDNVTKEVTDNVTKQVTDNVTKQVTDNVTKQVTDNVTKQVTDNVTKQVTDNVTKEVNKKLRHKFLEEGRDEGRYVEALEIARNMKEEKFPAAQISKFTKLSIEQINAL